MTAHLHSSSFKCEDAAVLFPHWLLKFQGPRLPSSICNNEEHYQHADLTWKILLLGVLNYY